MVKGTLFVYFWGVYWIFRARMKKLDKLILKSFFGPFLLTFLVVVFILLTQYMLKYFDDFVGKDLGMQVFSELIFYFSINMTQVALPLAILLSSLMTFGNLGENFELTAIKSAGISLLRTLRPLFLAVLFISALALMNNNFIVPQANIKAYSLLYDIRQKKPSLDIREGQFYGGIPGYSIKVREKLPDEVTMRDVIIYDHTKEMGNNNVIVADSCRMYTILDDRYLIFELFNGNYYSETRQAEFNRGRSYSGVNDLLRNEFSQMKLVMSMASFDLNRTKEELFAGNRLMKNIGELTHDIDSMNNVVGGIQANLLTAADGLYDYHLKERRIKRLDSLRKLSQLRRQQDSLMSKDGVAEVSDSLSNKPLQPDSGAPEQRNVTGAVENYIEPEVAEFEAINRGEAEAPRKMDAPLSGANARLRTLPERVGSSTPPASRRRMAASRDTTTFEEFFNRQSNVNRALNDALVKARYIKTNLSNQNARIESLKSEIYRHEIEKHKKVALACSCIIMFLIGAPLGSIIKKGGFGVPVILSIAFFIVFYVVTIMGEKYAREGLMDGALAAWLANLVLLPFGLTFLKKARNDSRLFETDAYIIWWEQVSKRFQQNKLKYMKA